MKKNIDWGMIGSVVGFIGSALGLFISMKEAEQEQEAQEAYIKETVSACLRDALMDIDKNHEV